MGDQLALALPPLRRDPGDTYAPGPANAGPRAALSAWTSWPSGALALVGPAQSGKSHLAAVWAKDVGGAVIAADRWAGDPETVLNAATAPLVLEDADGPMLTGIDGETAVFTVLKAARLGHVPAVLFTARTRPAGWYARTPDLATRLAALPIAEIGDPTDEDLQFVLTKMFLDRGVNPSEALLAYVLARIERSYEAAGAVVDALDRRAMAGKRRITRALAAEHFAEQDLWGGG